MLIGISGPICSGKHTTAEYLVQHHNFLRLHLPSPTTTRQGPTDQTPDPRLLPTTTDLKGTRGLTFPDVDSLLDFVTKRWREHWVLTDISSLAVLELLLRRPFFLLISVDAPVSLRYRRFTSRCERRGVGGMGLEEFVGWNDMGLYGTGVSTASAAENGSDDGTHSSTTTMTTGIAHLLPRAHLQLLNNHASINTYYAFLSTLDLPSPIRLRPTWDAYFMTLASLASLRSNCMKRRVGCVLVHNSRIISTGYNGTPRNLKNCNEGGCDRCNSARQGGVGLATCLCLHAEENALLEAGRERIREGAVLYCDTCPCLTCSVKIAQVGVKEVVYSQSYNMDDQSRRVLKEAGVELRQYFPPRSGLVGTSADQEGVLEEVGQDLVLRNGTHQS